MASSMSLSEAERMLGLHSPYTSKEVEGAYSVKMRALNNAYSMAAGPEQDRLDTEKVKAKEARAILLSQSSHAAPRPGASARKTTTHQRRQPAQSWAYKPPPGYSQGGANSPVGIFNAMAGEARKFVGAVAQTFSINPQMAVVLLGMSVLMGILTLFGGKTAEKNGRGAEVMVLSDPMAQVFMDGRYLTDAPFVNPVRIAAGRRVEFRFSNPAYQPLTRTIMVNENKRYTFKVFLDEGTCEASENSEEVAK